jgi:pimeloyl-ACP methyl ester carboxylesterase
MRNSALTVAFLIMLLITFSDAAFKTKKETIEVNLFSETFGNQSNPAILLNAGAGNQAISWPDEFCTKLAARGYFVIRYDYRDTGLSTAIDFDKNPYNVMDLAFDTFKILNKYNVKKATYVGFSMGGELAQLVGGFHPKYATSLVLIGTSANFKVGFDAFAGVYHNDGLSPPNKDYIAWATRRVDVANQTLDEKVDAYVHTWKMLDGSPSNFDEAFFKAQGQLNYSRTKLWQPYVNHSKAMLASFQHQETAPALITIPTLIIQGANDPVFPPDHGRDLNSKIAGSKLLVLDSFAHAISPRNFDKLVNEIDGFLKALK